MPTQHAIPSMIELQGWRGQRMALVCTTCEETIHVWDVSSLPLSEVAKVQGMARQHIRASFGLNR